MTPPSSSQRSRHVSVPVTLTFVLLAGLATITATAAPAAAANLPPDCVQIDTGILQGATDTQTGVRSFKGVPFAAPPVGDLRWKEPQPVAPWPGTRPALNFGPRAMQRPIFSDMVFRSDGMSEDCLYLNVWTPAKSADKRLPVLLYFYGGGFVGGDGSELRYDGESMARRGVVSVTVNYRLGVFGFLALKELASESPHHASGNYGLLDQNAALQWVRRNIAAFGGDPSHITIAGESAGSFSVSAQMASPLSRNLIAGAIGESGSLLGRPLPSLESAAENGAKLETALEVNSLADLRAIPADKLLEDTAKRDMPRVGPDIDGWFLPKDPTAIFTAGEQAHVPLLVGWNSAEGGGPGSILRNEEPTAENLANAIRRIYGDHADDVLKVYAVDADDSPAQVATDMAGDQFIAFGTWKWFDLQRRTGGQPVYRYWFSRPRPAMAPPGHQPAAPGASHSSEIEYALGNLPGNKVYAWTMDDYVVSDNMETYFANFIKTGNPNGSGLPAWPANTRHNPAQVMRIDVRCQAMPAPHDNRYQVLENLPSRR